MEQTLTALAGILIKAIPTVILVLLIHFYLKYMYFRPVEKVLQARFEATEGARQAAERSVARAGEKAAQYEAAIRAARAEIHREWEAMRGRLRAEQEQQIREARESTQAAVAAAVAQLGEEVEQAKRTLAGESDALAEQITNVVLGRRAA